jgi:hypothetical protein
MSDGMLAGPGGHLLEDASGYEKQAQSQGRRVMSECIESRAVSSCGCGPFVTSQPPGGSLLFNIRRCY